MSFIDKFKTKANEVSGTASSVASKAVSKSRTAASITRLKLAVNNEEDKLRKAYIELGRLFCRDTEAQADIDMVEYTPWLEKVSEAKATIQRLTEEMDQLKTELRGEATVNENVDVAEVAIETENEERTTTEEMSDTVSIVNDDCDEDTSIFADSTEA